MPLKWKIMDRGSATKKKENEEEKMKKRTFPPARQEKKHLPQKVVEIIVELDA